MYEFHYFEFNCSEQYGIFCNPLTNLRYKFRLKSSAIYFSRIYFENIDDRWIFIYLLEKKTKEDVEKMFSEYGLTNLSFGDKCINPYFRNDDTRTFFEIIDRELYKRYGKSDGISEKNSGTTLDITADIKLKRYSGHTLKMS